MSRFSPSLLSSVYLFNSKQLIFIIRYALENECQWEDKICVDPSDAGSIDCLRYAIENLPIPLISYLH